MAVRVGMASIDENGKAKGGKAGDQTKKEVYIRNWYKPNYGWDYVIRAKDPVMAESLAVNMESACKNDNIGYDQWERETLITELAKVGWDFNKIATPVETDCSALIAAVVAVCGVDVNNLKVGGKIFYTGNMVDTLNKTGKFDILSDSKYLNSQDYLKRGDIIVNTVHHTMMALDNGSKAAATTVVSTPKVTTAATILKKGSKGDAVKTLQSNLNTVINAGLVVDGDFGANTDTAVRKFQKQYGLTVDGEYGPASAAKMTEALKNVNTKKYGIVTASRLNVRASANGTIVKIISKGTKVEIISESNGWIKIAEGQYVSSQYIQKI